MGLRNTARSRLTPSSGNARRYDRPHTALIQGFFFSAGLTDRPRAIVISKRLRSLVRTHARENDGNSASRVYRSPLCVGRAMRVPSVRALHVAVHPGDRGLAQRGPRGVQEASLSFRPHSGHRPKRGDRVRECQEEGPRRARRNDSGSNQVDHRRQHGRGQ